MASLAENTQVFIVRFWREAREIAGAAPEWRGVIEHLSGGERRYMKDLDEITAFIALYVPGIRRGAKTTKPVEAGAKPPKVGGRKGRPPKS